MGVAVCRATSIKMDRRITEGIVLLSVILGAVAGPFFPLNVPVSDNFGYLNLGEISARTQFQYPLVQTIPQDFLQVKSPLLAAPRTKSACRRDASSTRPTFSSRWTEMSTRVRTFSNSHAVDLLPTQFYRNTRQEQDHLTCLGTS